MTKERNAFQTFDIRNSWFDIRYYFSFYSLRSDCTGLARAARMAW
jgi:hypothetical protein